MVDYGSTLARQGEYEQADQLLSEALSKRRKLLGNDHGDTQVSMENLASLRDNQARYEEADRDAAQDT